MFRRETTFTLSESELMKLTDKIRALKEENSRLQYLEELDIFKALEELRYYKAEHTKLSKENRELKSTMSAVLEKLDKVQRQVLVPTVPKTVRISSDEILKIYA